MLFCVSKDIILKINPMLSLKNYYTLIVRITSPSSRMNPNYNTLASTIGDKRYELTNYIGNVLPVVFLTLQGVLAP